MIVRLELIGRCSITSLPLSARMSYISVLHVPRSRWYAFPLTVLGEPGTSSENARFVRPTLMLYLEVHEADPQAWSKQGVSSLHWIAVGQHGRQPAGRGRPTFFPAAKTQILEYSKSEVQK